VQQIADGVLIDFADAYRVLVRDGRL